MARTLSAISAVVFASLVGVFGGCSEDAKGPPVVIDPPPVDDPGDLYDPAHIVEIAIEMDPADAEAMAHETRALLDLLSGDDCLSQPFTSPYNFYHADVTIDGFTRKDVGVRKKGFVGSLSTTKPSLKIDLNEFVSGQSLGDYERFTLNNSNQDPSLLRTCLTYQIFASAGLPAPRCNFAHVVIDGVDLGIYANVEPINADFVQAHFDDSGGNLYEGTLSDFRPEFLGTFEKETNQDDPSLADLDALTAALAVPDAELEAALEPLVALDEFYTFWAAEVLTNHWDGYTNNTNNYYAYDDPSRGFRFVVSGPDGALGPDLAFQAGANAPASVFASGMLAHRLYLADGPRAAYLGRLQELLDTSWDEAALGAEIDRMEALLAPYGIDKPAIQEVRTFVKTRRQVLLAELAGGPPPWPYPLREALCLADLGTLDATFSTTFGTIGQNPFTAGSGTFEVTLGGVPDALGMVGALAGFDANAPQPTFTVQHVGLRSDGNYDVLIVNLDPSEAKPGASLPFDLFGTSATLVVFDPTDMSFAIVGIVDGTLTFDEAATSSGAPVVGSISGKLIEALGN